MSSDDLKRDSQDRYASMMDRRHKQAWKTFVVLMVATIALAIILLSR